MDEGSPLIAGRRPLIGLDLWERRRDDSIEEWRRLIDWENAGRRYETIARDRSGARGT